MEIIFESSYKGLTVLRRMLALKIRWLLSILLMSGIVTICVIGIALGASGKNSRKIYTASAPWSRTAAPKESDTIPKSLAELIENKKHPDLGGKNYNLPSPWTVVEASADSKTSTAGTTAVKQKKMYTNASPWTIIETKKSSPPKPPKTRTNRKSPPKPRKIFAIASPWIVDVTDENSSAIQNLPKPEKIFTSTSPWAKAAPAHGTKIKIEKYSAITPLNPSRMVVCDLRLVRISDARVISQVSALGSYANINRLAEKMVTRLRRDSSGGSVVVMMLCNRRGTAQGQLVAGEMSQNVTTALKNTRGFRFVRALNLREILPTEQKLESAKDITAPRFRVLLNGADLVLIGGVALNKLSPTLNSANTSTTTGSDLN